MNDSTTKALIAAASLVIGALFTAAASAYSARQKTREIELTYRQKLDEIYLGNARQYIIGVYTPLSIALTKLSSAYRTFRAKISFNPKSGDPAAEAAFKIACQDYLITTSNLFDQGADAFLTTALDESLQSFDAFVRDSIGATTPMLKVVVSYSLSLPGAGFMSRNRSVTTVVSGKWAGIARLGDFQLDFLGTGFTYRSNKLLLAPLSSKEFEERISSDIPAMKFLIKEVTLGAQSHVK